MFLYLIINIIFAEKIVLKNITYMEGLNSTMLIGNVGTVNALNHLSNDKKILTLTIATVTSHYNQQNKKVSETEWHDIVLWNYLADLGSKYIRKGDLIFIEGKLKYRQNKTTGAKIVEIIAQNFKVLNSKVSNSDSTPEEEMLKSESDESGLRN